MKDVHHMVLAFALKDKLEILKSYTKVTIEIKKHSHGEVSDFFVIVATSAVSVTESEESEYIITAICYSFHSCSHSFIAISICTPTFLGCMITLHSRIISVNIT
jgi:hypothetical protein